jgi:signal transduction histidine kinase/DNA-binding response OmpR family regulator
MKKNKNRERIKSKVITGFILILLLSMIAVFAVIQLATQLSLPDTGTSQPVVKLTLISNMLSRLIDADGQARAYITTGQKKYLTRYREDEMAIRMIADSLKYTSVNQPEQYRRMQTVDSLLDLKRATLESYFRISRAGTGPILSDERLNQMLDHFMDTITYSTSTVSDNSLPVAAEKKEPEQQKRTGLFRRLWTGITGRQQGIDSVAVAEELKGSVPDTIHTFTRLPDTTIARVKSQLKQMGEEERLERQMALERELMLLRTDQVILDEIRNVLILFEKEEINRAIEGSENANILVKRLWNTALILATAGLITIIVFIILIWKDLARSAYYRRETEKARALAEELLKVKEMFLANMSHEIRTPITSIIGFTEKLSSMKLGKVQSEYLRYINNSSGHLLGLIDNLLDYSRIGSDKFTLESHPFKPEELLNEAFETLKPRGEQKGLRMKFVSSGEPGLSTLGDPLRIRQIIFNLLNNSIKFTETGEIELALDTKREGDTVQIEILVSDTGIGIPEEKQQDIFREFTQVDEGITRKYGGSGLGLAICSKLAAQMNGSISLKSNPGEGTRFRVVLTLPWYNGEIPEKISETVKERPDLSGLSILLAEDDITTRILIEGLLKEMGANVDAAGDGAAAYELFIRNKGNYGLIMTDIQMPGMSGPELTVRLIRQAEEQRMPLPPVMGLTAHATRSDLHRYSEAGMQYFLIKPFRQAELFKILMTIPGIVKGSGDKATQNTVKPEITVRLEAFTAFSGGDPESLKKILISLRDNLRNTMEAMQNAFTGENYKQLALLAHRILPNIRNLGAEKETSLLLKLEALRDAAVHDKEEIREVISELLPGMEKLATILEQKTEDY